MINTRRLVLRKGVHPGNFTESGLVIGAQGLRSHPFEAAGLCHADGTSGLPAPPPAVCVGGHGARRRDRENPAPVGTRFSRRRPGWPAVLHTLLRPPVLLNGHITSRRVAKERRHSAAWSTACRSTQQHETWAHVACSARSPSAPFHLRGAFVNRGTTSRRAGPRCSAVRGTTGCSVSATKAGDCASPATRGDLRTVRRLAERRAVAPRCPPAARRHFAIGTGGEYKRERRSLECFRRPHAFSAGPDRPGTIGTLTRGQLADTVADPSAMIDQRCGQGGRPTLTGNGLARIVSYCVGTKTGAASSGQRIGYHPAYVRLACAVPTRCLPDIQNDLLEKPLCLSVRRQLTSCSTRRATGDLKVQRCGVRTGEGYGECRPPRRQHMRAHWHHMKSRITHGPTRQKYIDPDLGATPKNDRDHGIDCAKPPVPPP